jgi:hypothetical protein
VNRASILDLKLVQAFVRVSLARNPHLLDQITGFVARLGFDFLFRNTTYKTVKRVAVRQAGKPDLLHPHLRKVLFEPVLHPLAVLGRAAVLLEDVRVISRYLSASFDTIFSYLPCSS